MYIDTNAQSVLPPLIPIARYLAEMSRCENKSFDDRIIPILEDLRVNADDLVKHNAVVQEIFASNSESLMDMMFLFLMTSLLLGEMSDHPSFVEAHGQAIAESSSRLYRMIGLVCWDLGFSPQTLACRVKMSAQMKSYIGVLC